MKDSLRKILKHKYAPLLYGAMAFALFHILGVQIIFAFFLGIAVPAFILIVKRYGEIKKHKRLTDQIPETVRAIANAMKAGYSFEQALTFVARESADPIGEHLNETVRELDYNFSTEEILTNLKRRAAHSDMNLIVDGILMQYRIGGNLIEMLGNMADMTNDRIKLQNDLKAFTAQGRFSGILVSLLFPLSLFMFSMISPDYVAPMYHTLPGQFLLIFAIILEIIGFRLIWKITHIKF
ncbi:hypothetical protein HOG48_04335 [Candidatus Peregrinibacteria bacterium]|jgi:tight adherence protein B|nr:hypothetical protein [Candidatus Peregrinibacteria bacterium]